MTCLVGGLPPRPAPEHLLVFLWGVLTELVPDAQHDTQPDAPHDTPQADSKSETPQRDYKPDTPQPDSRPFSPQPGMKPDSKPDSKPPRFRLVAPAPAHATEGPSDASTPAHATVGPGDIAAQLTPCLLTAAAVEQSTAGLQPAAGFPEGPGGGLPPLPRHVPEGPVGGLPPRPGPEHLLVFLGGVLTELVPDAQHNTQPDAPHDTPQADSKSDTPQPGMTPDSPQPGIKPDSKPDSKPPRFRLVAPALAHATEGLGDTSAPAHATEGPSDASAPAHATEGSGRRLSSCSRH
ncbi:hypothetical protein CRENBAI_016727 [Crenichthys baileyi]|uniref:Uncharacterized protein n=1 Tax=Crenichthys baileyi TaxID=28760 RepID=A0AAV9R1E0_9TELE